MLPSSGYVIDAAVDYNFAALLASRQQAIRPREPGFGGETEKSTFSLSTSLNFIVFADIISLFHSFRISLCFSFVHIVFSPILSAHTMFSFLHVSFSLHLIICCSPCHSQLDRRCFVQNGSVVYICPSSHVTHCPPFHAHKALSCSLLLFHSIYCRSITTKQELIS
jgi:hypothetical protein